MLAEDVRWVEMSWDELEVDSLGCHCLPGVVIGQCMMTLLEGGMWCAPSLDHGSVVAEQSGRTLNVHAEVAQVGSQAHDLLGGQLGSYKLRSICGCLHGRLLLGEPFNWSAVQEVKGC